MSTEILIVEDSPTQAEQLRFLLEENGYSVRVAQNGVQGLAMARECRPDLVISDVIMPHMDGFALCRAMRADAALHDVPVVILTTYAGGGNIVRGLECGAHNFLRKPFDATYLVQRVRFLLDRLHQRGADPGPGEFRLSFGGLNDIFGGDREQILDLLVSTYEHADRLNAELQRQRDSLAAWQASLTAVHDAVIAMNVAASPRELVETTAEKLLRFPGVAAVRLETREPAMRVVHPGLLDGEPDPVGHSIALPLQLGPRSLGSLLVTTQPGVDLSPHHQLLLVDLCHQFAVALERLLLLASLDHRVLERSRELEKEIHERLRSEQQLDASEHRYRLLFERNLAGIVQSSLDGRVIDCNPAFVRMTGYDHSSQLRGESVTRFWKRPHDHAVLVQQLLREGEVSSIGGELLRRDGTVCSVLANATLAEIEGADPVIEMTLVDLTEYKLLEARFRQAQKMESLGLLAGGIAHDFNNLLSVILAYSETLREPLASLNDANTNLDGIFSVTQKARDLTRQLLAFSRRQVMMPRPIDLNQIIVRDLPLFQRLLGSRIEIIQQPAAQLPLVQGDPSQIDQVLLNLVVNARDAMPGGGEIHLSTRVAEFDRRSLPPVPEALPGRFAVIHVRDTGCGMDPATAARIFDPFFTTKGDRGTGLGLSTVHGIVVQSGGFVQVESQINLGTTVSLFFPCLDAPGAGSPRLDPIEPPVRILIVDDEADLRQMLGERLTSCGMNVAACGDAASALQCVREMPVPPHLLLTDLRLPDRNGFDLARSLQQQFPALRVILISGDPCDREAAARAGFPCAYLAKPFEFQQLFRSIQRMIEGDPD